MKICSPINMALLFSLLALGLFVSREMPINSPPSISRIVDTASLDVTPVRVRLGTANYSIPRNNIVSITTPEDGTKAGIQLVLKFPSFQGAMTAQDLQDFRARNLWNSSNLLSIRGPAIIVPDKNQIIEYAKAHGIAGAGQRPVEWSEPQGRYAIEPTAAGDGSFSVSCARLSHVRCSDFINLPGGYIIFCQYDEALLPDRRAIHQGVLKVFASFRSNDSAAVGIGSR